MYSLHHNELLSTCIIQYNFRRYIQRHRPTSSVASEIISVCVILRLSKTGIYFITYKTSVRTSQETSPCLL